MITTIVLSAGESRRFGSPKALANINNTTPITQIQQKLLISSVDQVIVVLGAQADLIKPKIIPDHRIQMCLNQEYLQGQLSSIKLALTMCLKDCSGALIWPVDCPFISRLTIESIINEHHVRPGTILIPTFAGKRGHPPMIPKKYFKKILNMPNTQGLNTLFNDIPSREVALVDKGITLSFNTPDELNSMRE